MSTVCLPYMKVSGKGPNYRFFGLPKQLLTGSAFRGLHRLAKLLYSMMLDRLSLSESKEQEYRDDQGRLYIIYTIQQVREDLRCSKGTAVKLMKQLADIGLIEKKRRGQGKPSLLYIKDFQALEEPEKVEAEQAQPAKSSSQKSGVLDFLNSKFFTSETADRTATPTEERPGEAPCRAKGETEESSEKQEKSRFFARFKACGEALRKNAADWERGERRWKSCFQKLKFFTSRS